MDTKPRYPFIVLDKNGDKYAHGTYYPNGGNVQLYIKSEGNVARQYHSLSEVLLLEAVESFIWGTLDKIPKIHFNINPSPINPRV